MATRIAESSIIAAPVSRVWELIRPFNFAYFKAVKSVDASSSTVGGVRTVTYADGTTQKLKLNAMSDHARCIGWDVIESVPALDVSGVTHSVRLFRVTTTDTTYIEWDTTFSKDVSLPIMEDARYKQREHFLALAAALAGGKTATAAAAVDSKTDVKSAPAPAATAAAGGKTFDWENKTGKREMLENASQVAALASELDSAPTTFTKLRLSGHSFSPEAAKAMAITLAKTTALTSADLSDIIAVRSTPDVVAALTSITGALAVGNKSLTELNVSDNALGCAGVTACAALLNNHKSGAARLQVLKFNNNGLESDAAEFITKSVLAGGSPTALRTFEIHNNCLSDGGAIGLAPLLAASPLLERLRFTTTRLGEEGGAALVQGLVDGKSRNFVSIEISDNSIGEDAGALFVKEVLSNQPKLVALNIGDTGFGTKAITAALDALHKTAPDLQSLDLNNLDIDCKLVINVAKLVAARPRLTRLSLEGNDITDKGAKLIAEAIKSHANLSELNLSGNSLTTATVATLMAALKDKAGLKKLNLNANRFSKAGITAIKAGVKAMNLSANPLETLSDNDDDGDDDADDAEVADKLAKGVANMSIKK